MSTMLNMYGESAGSVAGAVIGACTATVPASHQYKITKVTVTMEGIGYAYIQVAAANVFAMYFWGAGQQSEDNLTFIIPAAAVVRGWVVQAGGVQVTRMALTGYDELTAV
jgi:peroxiredoxin